MAANTIASAEASNQRSNGLVDDHHGKNPGVKSKAQLSLAGVWLSAT